MTKLTIRCHPCTPARPDDLQAWLEDTVNELRGDGEHEVVRLSRLTQELPGDEIEMGWLLEIELLHGCTSAQRAELMERLTDTLADMRLLGLQPTTLAPLEPIDRVDEMSAASFPASDPPAVWAWERGRS